MFILLGSSSSEYTDMLPGSIREKAAISEQRQIKDERAAETIRRALRLRHVLFVFSFLITTSVPFFKINSQYQIRICVKSRDKILIRISAAYSVKY